MCREVTEPRTPSTAPTSATTSSAAATPDELDDVHAGQGRLARQHLGDPGLADAPRAEHGGQPAAGHRRADPRQVVLATEQLVAVEAHPGPHRVVGGQQLLVEPLQVGVGVDAEPVGEPAAIRLVALESGGRAGHGGLGAQERRQQRGIPRSLLVRLLQERQGLGRATRGDQRAGPAAHEDGPERLHVGDQVRPRAGRGVHGRRRQVEGLGRQLHRRRVTAAEGALRPDPQPVQQQQVDVLGREPEPVAAVAADDDVGAALGADPRDQHLQGLHRVGGDRVGPHLLDQAGVGEARGVPGQGDQQRRDPLTGNPAPPPAHLAEQLEGGSGHRPRIESGHCCLSATTARTSSPASSEASQSTIPSSTQSWWPSGSCRVCRTLRMRARVPSSVPAGSPTSSGPTTSRAGPRASAPVSRVSCSA